MVDLENNLAMVSVLSSALDELSDSVVYVGGSVVGLYIDIKGTPEPSPSVDLDCVVEVIGYGGYTDMQEILRKKGFKDIDPEDETDKTFIRMYLNKMKIDFLPSDESVLGVGFSNPFFKDGIQKKQRVSLPDGVKIYILPLESFFATKFKAYFDRGVEEPLYSQDLEDIVAILDGKSNIEAEFSNTTPEESQFLKESILNWLDNWDTVYREAVGANLPYSKVEKRVEEIKGMLESIHRKLK
jgi:hypothetical protein